MSLSPETLYLQLVRLIEGMPDLWTGGPIAPETQRWLGRASALVGEVGDLSDLATINVAVSTFDARRHDNVQKITSIVYRALARAELKAPLAIQGAFIAAGNTFDAFVAFSKVVSEAKADVMIVDPYMDEKALSDFAVLTPEGVPIRLLADARDHKATLEPAVRRWSTQFTTRPLEVRLSPPGYLHDRLIFLDRADAWNISQSLNALAVRSHASISRFDAETRAMKLAAYEALWLEAKPL